MDRRHKPGHHFWRSGGLLMIQVPFQRKCRTAFGASPKTVGAGDESQAIGVTVQRDEPSIEAEKISSAEVIDGKKQTDNLSVTIASLGQAAIDPLMEAQSALHRRDYATAQRLFEACDRKDVGRSYRGSVAGPRSQRLMQRRCGSLRRSGKKASPLQK